MSKLIGFGSEQVPTNSMLGDLAFKNENDVVTTADIGINPNQIPLNMMLGSMAFQNSDSPTIGHLQVNTLDKSNRGSSFPYNVITGQKRLTAANTYHDLFVCGHTHLLTGYISVFNGSSVNNGGRIQIVNFGTIYGGNSNQTVQHETAYANGLTVSSISYQYVNSGSPNYKYQIAANYSGTNTDAVTVYYAICGISERTMYGLP